MQSIQGRFLWYELMTTDPGAAVNFYSKVIGWGTQDWENPDMKYTMFTASEIPLAGVWKMTPEMAGMPPHWVAYVGTDDIAATVSRAKALGATVHIEHEVAEVGKFAMLGDPQGATIALYQPDKDPGVEEQPGPKDFSWHELATTDHRAAMRFYSELFGWGTQQEVDMGELGLYVLFGRGDRQYGGMFNMPPQIPVPNWLLYVRVSGLNAALDRVRQNGGQVLNGPMEVPGGDLVAQCMDPQGAAFALHETHH